MAPSGQSLSGRLDQMALLRLMPHQLDLSDLSDLSDP
jgi:hypothetical protein